MALQIWYEIEWNVSGELRWRDTHVCDGYKWRPQSPVNNVVMLSVHASVYDRVSNWWSNFISAQEAPAKGSKGMKHIEFGQIC